MVKRVQIKTFSGVPETWRHVVAMRNPAKMFLYKLRFKIDGFISELDLTV